MTDASAPTTASSSSSMRMHIATARPAARPKEIKVVLPNEMRIKLHSLKLLTGVTIAETIETALTFYFQHGIEPSAPATPPSPVEA